MPYAEFYNLNANITYPFVTTSTDTFNFVTGRKMPNDLVVDCGFNIGPRLAYDPEVGAVYLSRVRRTGDELYLTFNVRPGNKEIIFIRNKDAEFGETTYTTFDGGPLYGVGFLVTGNVRPMYDMLDPGQEDWLMSYSVPGHLETYEATVEPALVISNKGQVALSVSVGNMIRLSDGPCDGCGSYPPVIDDKTVKLQSAAGFMVGRIKFRGGYNVAATISPASNALSLSAVVGEGFGEVCSADPIRYVGDTPETGSRCKDFIFTINGITPNAAGAFQLEGGGSFVVKPATIGSIIVNSRLSTQMVCAGEE